MENSRIIYCPFDHFVESFSLSYLFFVSPHVCSFSDFHCQTQGKPSHEFIDPTFRVVDTIVANENVALKACNVSHWCYPSIMLSDEIYFLL